MKEHDTACVAKPAILLLDMEQALSAGIPSGKTLVHHRLCTSQVLVTFSGCRTREAFSGAPRVSDEVVRSRARTPECRSPGCRRASRALELASQGRRHFKVMLVRLQL